MQRAAQLRISLVTVGRTILTTTTRIARAKKEGYKDEATLDNKMGGVEGQVKMCRTLTRKWQIGHTQKIKLDNKLSTINLVSAHPTNIYNPLVVDTGSTAHFLQNTTSTTDYIHTTIPVTNITATPSGIQVLLPNNTKMKATHTGLIDIPQLPTAARQAHIFSSLASGSLLSIGQLYDHGWSAYFDKTKLYIMYNGHIIMQGSCGPTKLWSIDAPQT